MAVCRSGYSEKMYIVSIDLGDAVYKFRECRAGKE